MIPSEDKMEKYETLLNAVLALDPFEYDFLMDDEGECTKCETYGHTPECPVTLLRNILNGVQLESIPLTQKAIESSLFVATGYSPELLAEIEAAAHAETARVFGSIEAQNKTKQTILSKCIKSPTDNGV
jgi:hypothetical protein